METKLTGEEVEELLELVEPVAASPAARGDTRAGERNGFYWRLREKLREMLKEAN